MGIDLITGSKLQCLPQGSHWQHQQCAELHKSTGGLSPSSDASWPNTETICQPLEECVPAQRGSCCAVLALVYQEKAWQKGYLGHVCICKAADVDHLLLLKRGPAAVRSHKITWSLTIGPLPPYVPLSSVVFLSVQMFLRWLWEWAVVDSPGRDQKNSYVILVR